MTTYHIGDKVEVDFTIIGEGWLPGVVLSEYYDLPGFHYVVKITDADGTVAIDVDTEFMRTRLPQ